MRAPPCEPRCLLARAVLLLAPTWHRQRVLGPDGPRAAARAVGMGIRSAAAQEINPHLSVRILSSLTCQIHRETVTKCLCANDAEF